MTTPVHFDFKYGGPFGEEMAMSLADLAISITIVD